MKNRYITLASAAIALALGANAITTQKIHLKNGSVLNGYISYQDMKGNLTVMTDSAVICISDDFAKTGRNVTKSLDELRALSSAWADWAISHNALSGSGSDGRMQMNEIDFIQKRYMSKDGNIDITDSIIYYHPTFEDRLVRTGLNRNPVKILEKGSVIKYLELTPSSYMMNWDDIDRIVADKRPQTALSGTNRSYHLKNGSIVSGQYAGETVNTVSTYTADGMIETIDKSQIDRLYIEPFNPSQSIVEQSELIDKVETSDKSSYKGVITQRDYSPNVMNLEIVQNGGSRNKVKLTDIISYSKEENNVYKPLFDILPAAKELLINRISADSVNVTKNGDFMILDSIPGNVKIPATNNAGGTSVCIEFSNPENIPSYNIILVKLSKERVKKKELVGFVNDVDIMTKYRPVSSSTSANKTTKIEFLIPERGWFAVYDPKTKKAMPFKIE